LGGWDYTVPVLFFLPHADHLLHFPDLRATRPQLALTTDCLRSTFGKTFVRFLSDPPRVSYARGARSRRERLC